MAARLHVASQSFIRRRVRRVKCAPCGLCSSVQRRRRARGCGSFDARCREESSDVSAGARRRGVVELKAE